MPLLPKAILFDLDDTILSMGGREALVLSVVGEFAEEIAPIPVPEPAAEIEGAFLEFWAAPGRYAEWRTRVLEARTKVVERLFTERQLDLDLARRVALRFHERRETDRDRLFPGAVATLEELRRRGVRLALVT
ncbi:HAD family hydrolase, partial [bacterium]